MIASGPETIHSQRRLSQRRHGGVPLRAAGVCPSRFSHHGAECSHRSLAFVERRRAERFHC